MLLRPIFCEKLKIAPPIEKQPPLKRLNFRIWPKNQSQFRLFFFGDHLNLGGKNLWISDFGRKISLNFGEDLFFCFGDHLILGGKNLRISELSEKFRLNFRTNRVKLIQEQWKFGSRSFALFSLFQNSPPPLFQILATRLLVLWFKFNMSMLVDWLCRSTKCLTLNHLFHLYLLVFP